MISVNLIPYRAAERNRCNRLFGAVVLASVCLGAAAMGGFYLYSENTIDLQRTHNEMLTAALDGLTKKQQELQALDMQIKSLVERSWVIENLQQDRAVIAVLLDQLVRYTPDGVYYKSVKQNKDGTITLDGFVETPARTATLLASLAQSPLFSNPTLIESQAAMTDKRELNTIILRFALDMSAYHRSAAQEDASVRSAFSPAVEEQPTR